MRFIQNTVCLAALTFLLSFKCIAAPFFEASLSTSDILLKKVWQHERALISAHYDNGADVDESAYLPAFLHPESVWALSSLWMYGDPKPLYDTLHWVQHPQNHTFSRETHSPLASNTLDWPELISRYAHFSGDFDRANILTKAYLPLWLDYFSMLEDYDGTLSASRIPPQWKESKPLGWTEEIFMVYLNVEYLDSLITADEIGQQFRLENNDLTSKIERLKNGLQEKLASSAILQWNEEMPPDQSLIPLLATGLNLGVLEESFRESFIQLLRKHGLPKEEWTTPSVLEACILSDEPQLAYDLLTFADSNRNTPVMTISLYESILGISTVEAGGSFISFAPAKLTSLNNVKIIIPVLSGKITYQSLDQSDQFITTPTGVGVLIDADQGVRTVVQTSVSHDNPEELTQAQHALLESKNWAEWNNDKPSIWVSVKEQMFRIIKNESVIYQTRCATASKGTGSMMNSLKTPLGWHSINKKVGKDAPWGQVFRSRQATREVWQPGEDTDEDLVLSRILLLTGQEKGLNKGGNVDSYARNIYIHGTNDEARIGQPTSHGCIRLRNDDVIEIFDWLEVDTNVLITDE
jgi:hypothetical protein